ncbi:MAG: hypothetical protein II876_05995 [Synergistaceae bacterium]|nr:hypothetical protein [Synergistaceae bacterium]
MCSAIVKGVEIAISAAGLLWSWATNTEVENANKARELAEKNANIWQNLFWFAVVVIAVLAFIIIRRHLKDRK